MNILIKIINKSIIVLISILFIGCHFIKSENIKRQNYPIKIGFNNLELVGNIKKEKSTIDTICRSWTLKNEDLNDILSKMDLVSFDEWYQYCYQYPCYYTGVVKNEKDTFEINVNSGSSIYIYNKKKSFYFILKDSSKLFIQPCNCCE